MLQNKPVQPAPVTKITFTGAAGEKQKADEEAQRHLNAVLRPPKPNEIKDNAQIKTAAPIVELDAQHLKGIIPDETIQSQNNEYVKEAAANAYRKLLATEYQTPEQSGLPSWLQTPLQKAHQYTAAGASYMGDTLQGLLRLTTGQTFNDKAQEAVLPKQQMDRIEEYFNKYDPQKLAELRSDRALSAYSPAANTAGGVSAAFAQSYVVAGGVGKILSGVPELNAIRAGTYGAKGIYALDVFDNAAATIAVQAMHGAPRGENIEAISKRVAASPSVLLPFSSSYQLAVGGLADYWAAKHFLGLSDSEALLHAGLNFGGNVARFSSISQRVNTYQQDTTRINQLFEEGLKEQGVPEGLRKEVIHSADKIYSYRKGNPDDVEGTMDLIGKEDGRLQKLFKEYKSANPTGERRMIGLNGPQETGPVSGGGAPAPKPPEHAEQTKLLADYYNTTPDDIAQTIRDSGSQDNTQIDKVLGEKYGKDPAKFLDYVDELKKGEESIADINAVEGARLDAVAPAAGPASTAATADTTQIMKVAGGREVQTILHFGQKTPAVYENFDIPKTDITALQASPPSQIGNLKVDPKSITNVFEDGGTGIQGSIHDPVQIFYDLDTGEYSLQNGYHRLIETMKTGGPLKSEIVFGRKTGDSFYITPEDVKLAPATSDITLPVQPLSTAFPSVFNTKPLTPPAPIQSPGSVVAAPKVPVPPDARTWSETLADNGGDPNVAPRATGEASGPSVIPQGTKPLQLPEARRMAIDLYKQLDSEYNPEFQSKAEFGPEFAGAEQNAGLAQELVTNPQTRGVLQQVTGKSGYAALENVELDNLGPFIKSLRDRTENGSPAALALDDIQARIRDDSNGEYGRMVLEQMISQARGEVRAKPARPTEEEILQTFDRAIQDGRLKMTDDAGNGRTVEQVYETLYNQLANRTDASKLPSVETIAPGPTNNNYANVKLAKNAARRARLGDILKKEDAKRALTPQQLRDASAEYALSNRDLEAIHSGDEQFAQALEQNRKMTQIEYNRTVQEAKQLPPETAKKIIADLEKMKASGKIATPLEARLQKNKFLEKLLTQQKGMTRAEQRKTVAAKKEANHEKMKSLYKTLPRMPGKIQKMMKFLHEGYRKSMPLAQQEQIVTQMKDLNEIGAQQNRLFKEKREAADAALAKEVVKTAVRRVKNREGRVRDRVKPLLMNETPPNLVIEDMGQGAMKVFKDSMDEGMNQAWPLQRDWDREVLNKAQEIGIKHEDMKQIVLYSLWNRGGKAGELAQARLKNMGLVDPRDPPALNAKQKQFYEWQQTFLKMLAGKTKEVYERENPLRELDISDPHYFPMKVVGNDFTVAKGPNTMSIDQVPDGFTKNIKGNEALDIYVEPDALFRHINDVAHYITLTERMQQMRRILERPEVIASLGNENVDYLQNRWLDLVARHGTYAEKVNEAMAILNSMGNRAYGGVLAMKAIVGVRQFGSVIDAMGPLLQKFGVGPTAKYLAKVIKNTPAIISEHWTELGKYIETNPDLQASIGLTDLVMEQVKGGEFSERHTFLERHPKLNKFAFAVIRQPDLLGRATLAMHVEGLYKAQGMEQPEAQRMAMRVVNNVFGSMRVHNRPTASGHANTRPLYLFGQTQRARQGMFRQAIKDWPKDPIGNSAVLGAYTLSSMILMYLSTLAMDDGPNKEKSQKQSIYWGWFYSALENTLPIVGPMLSRAMQTGDASNAIPYLGMVMNAVTSFRSVVTAKKPETKMKGAMRGTEQTMGVIGIPAPALRSNINVLMSLYHAIAGGSSPASLVDAETRKQMDQMKQDLQKELGNSGLDDMKKQLRKELQNVQ